MIVKNNKPQPKFQLRPLNYTLCFLVELDCLTMRPACMTKFGISLSTAMALCGIQTSEPVSSRSGGSGCLGRLPQSRKILEKSRLEAPKTGLTTFATRGSKHIRKQNMIDNAVQTKNRVEARRMDYKRAPRMPHETASSKKFATPKPEGPSSSTARRTKLS